MYRIGVDIGGTKVNVGLFDYSNKALVAIEKEFVKNISDLAEYIAKTAYKLADEQNINRSDVKFCGIGIPGTVSDDGKYVLKAPNISILPADLAYRVENILKIPALLIQDSRAAAFGEYIMSDTKYNTLVCVTLGTGIGTGIVIDGRIYNGALGSAGELGHLPVVLDGRPCGCGKVGCLEKYCAGGGLDLTAAELLGDGKCASDLFDSARAGNSRALKAISDASKMLGTALVAIVNLISPDCILFSGGLSAQKELYLELVIKFIEEKCYSSGRLPRLAAATLGELSPLYGAAFMYSDENECKSAKSNNTMLSASIMCADVLDFKKSLREIELSGIEYIHADIMDNHFVPNLMLPPQLLSKLRDATSLPFDYHIMAENPESIIETLDVRRGDIVSVHYESTYHLQRAVALIKEKGAQAAVAINPSTPISALEEIIYELDMVLVMTVNPGFAGQKIVPGGIDKIARLKDFLRSRSLDRILIEVDGNCSFENSVKMKKAGADIIVVGTSSVFREGQSIDDGVRKLRASLISAE